MVHYVQKSNNYYQKCYKNGKKVRVSRKEYMAKTRMRGGYPSTSFKGKLHEHLSKVKEAVQKHAAAAKEHATIMASKVSNSIKENSRNTVEGAKKAHGEAVKAAKGHFISLKTRVKGGDTDAQYEIDEAYKKHVPSLTNKNTDKQVGALDQQITTSEKTVKDNHDKAVSGNTNSSKNRNTPNNNSHKSANSTAVTSSTSSSNGSSSEKENKGVGCSIL